MKRKGRKRKAIKAGNGKWVSQIHDETVVELGVPKPVPNLVLGNPALLSDEEAQVGVDWYAASMRSYMKALTLGSAYGFTGTTTARWAKERRLDLPFPGISARRRVILDLTFHGHDSLSCLLQLRPETSRESSVILPISAPGARFDPVPGLKPVFLPLGEAVDRLVKAGAKFDLVVATVRPRETVTATGFFRQPPKLNPAGAPRLIVDLAPERKREELQLENVILPAVQALLSPDGEALVRFEGRRMEPEFARTFVGLESFTVRSILPVSGNQYVRWGVVGRDGLDAYVGSLAVSGNPQITRLCTGEDPERRLPDQWPPTPSADNYTRGQRDAFQEALLR